MILTREGIQRMIDGVGNGAAGGGGSDISALLAGYATESWVDENYLSIEFFSKLFKAYNSANPAVEIKPNDTQSTITNIKAMFGFWTEQYVSALGQNSGGGGGGASSLADLIDVQLGTLHADDILTYDGNSHWVNIGKSTFLTGYATQSWVSNQNYLTSVAFGDLTSHPTTLSGYGITDAKIQNGTITLGSNSITPLTSFTETDPTVPEWAKASTKPSYSFSEISGSVAFSQLPTLYWANIAISSSSDNTTEPQFANVRLRSGSENYGSYLRFGDGNYCYLYEDTDDHLKIYGKGVEITTSSGYNLTWGGNVVATQAWVGNQNFLTSVAFADLTSHPTTLSGYGITDSLNSSTTFWGQGVSNGVVKGGISNAMFIEFSEIAANAGYGGYIDFHFNGSSADFTSRIIEDESGRLSLIASNGVRIGDGVLLWDSANGALKVQRSDGMAANFYATGAVSALGMNSGSSGTIATLNITNQILFNDNDNGGTIMTDGGPLILSTNDNSDYIKVDDMVSMDGYNSWHIVTSGEAYFAESVRSPKFYLDATRYIFLDSGTLKYYNGTTTKTISVY